MDLTSGERHTAVGYQTSRHNVTGDYNSFFGWGAGRGSSGNSHNSNTAVGYQSMNGIGTGGNNVPMGANAMYGGVGAQSGSNRNESVILCY